MNNEEKDASLVGLAPGSLVEIHTDNSHWLLEVGDEPTQSSKKLRHAIGFAAITTDTDNLRHQRHFEGLKPNQICPDKTVTQGENLWVTGGNNPDAQGGSCTGIVRHLYIDDEQQF